MRKIIVFLSGVCLCAAIAADRAAASPAEAIRQAVAAAHLKRDGAKPEACSFLSIGCNQTVNAALGSSGCALSDGQLSDLYAFNGITGTTVTATLTSADFPPFLDLLDPSDNSAGDDGEPVVATVSGTLYATGQWVLGVTNFNEFLQTGNYTLSLQCSSGGGAGACSADGNTLCLNSNRFKVTATYNAGASGSGQAHAVSMTDDTGYLWFFASNNVETVIKLIDGCGTGGHYWVFAGGLTNVNVVITVTDTQTGAMRTYSNPQGTVFQPIQDTAAFASCP